MLTCVVPVAGCLHPAACSSDMGPDCQLNALVNNITYAAPINLCSVEGVDGGNRCAGEVCSEWCAACLPGWQAELRALTAFSCLGVTPLEAAQSWALCHHTQSCLLLASVVLQGPRCCDKQCAASRCLPRGLALRQPGSDVRCDENHWCSLHL